jgi:hypothetical protein
LTTVVEAGGLDAAVAVAVTGDWVGDSPALGAVKAPDADSDWGGGLGVAEAQPPMRTTMTIEGRAWLTRVSISVAR